jgi:hypothetical protein
VVRAFAFVSLLASLAVAGYLVKGQLATSGPKSPAGSRAIDMGVQAAAGVNFQQAVAALEQFRAANGTYAGASLAGLGVTLVRSDAASYCLEAVVGGTVFHETGPNGAPSAGRC